MEPKFMTATELDQESYRRLRICIIGTGNVGSHMFTAFGRHTDVSLISSRTLEGLPGNSDVYIIATSDDAIPEVSATLADRIGTRMPLVCHTSGSTPLSLLQKYFRRVGVIYPLQTFSRLVHIDYAGIPMFIEASQKSDLPTLESVARMMSENVTELTSEKRQHLHIAAVFACNFVNHCIAVAEDMLSRDGIDPAVLSPVIAETFAKLSRGQARYLQTGPAARGDMHTIEKHLEALESQPELRDIYATMSNDIARVMNLENA